MKKLKHKLTGCDAAAAKLLEEVQKIFHSNNHKIEPKDDWRLEFYIMQVMCADFCNMYEVEKDKVVNILKAAHSYDRPKKEVDTAFRRLVRGGFLYSKRRARVQFEPSRGYARYYGCALDRYDTDKVAA